MVEANSIISLKRDRFPMFSGALSFGHGALSDPIGQEGLSELTGRMLMRGSSKRKAYRYREAVDQLGSEMEIRSLRQSSTLHFDGLLRYKDELLSLILEALESPEFSEKELQKLKREVQAEEMALRDDDASLLMRHFSSAIYAGMPYARPLAGTALSHAEIGPEDLRHCLKNWRQTAAILGLISPFSKREEALFVEALLAPFEGPILAREAFPEIPKRKSGWRVIVVDKPQRSQSQVALGQLSIPYLHPDFAALDLAQNTFGGTFTSRLSHEMREKRGLSYGAYSYLSGDQYLGTFYMRFYPKTEDTALALALAHELYQDFLEKGPSMDEWLAAKSQLQHGFAFQIETAEQYLEELMHAKELGLPESHVDETVQRLMAIHYEDSMKALKAHLRGDEMCVVILGSMAALEKDLKALSFLEDIQVVDWQSL